MIPVSKGAKRNWIEIWDQLEGRKSIKLSKDNGFQCRHLLRIDDDQGTWQVLQDVQVLMQLLHIRVLHGQSRLLDLWQRQSQIVRAEGQTQVFQFILALGERVTPVGSGHRSTISHEASHQQEWSGQSQSLRSEQLIHLWQESRMVLDIEEKAKKVYLLQHVEKGIEIVRRALEVGSNLFQSIDLLQSSANVSLKFGNFLLVLLELMAFLLSLLVKAKKLTKKSESLSRPSSPCGASRQWLLQ